MQLGSIMDKCYTVKLYGELADQFGSHARVMYAKDMGDIIRGLISDLGVTFRTTLANGAFQIVLGNKKEDYVTETDTFLSEKLLKFPIKEQQIHIFPALQGAGGGGGGGTNQILLGVLLLVLAIAVPYLMAGYEAAFATECTAVSMESMTIGETATLAYTTIASSTVLSSLAIAGTLSIIGGIMSLIVPVPKMNYSVAQRQSFIFNGPVNNVHQGVPVPLIYGECITGSTVISASIQTANVNWNMLTYEQVQSGVQF